MHTFIRLTVLAALLVAAPPTATAAPWPPNSCGTLHDSTVAKRAITTIYTSPTVLTDQRRALARRWARCVTTRPKSRRLIRHLRNLAAWRGSYLVRWNLAWRRLPAHARGWTLATSACESGWPGRGHTKSQAAATNTGNGYFGAFQWIIPTWYAAGGDRHPTTAVWEHQAVLAWNWHVSHPVGQWPVCGE